MRKILILLMLMSTTAFAGNKVIDYGFEDWSGSASTTPGYIYTTSDSGYWADHIQRTGVVSDCSGNTAHTGTYYWHQNFTSAATDPCISNRTGGAQAYNNIGHDGTYPSGYGDNTDFETAITGNTLTIRFYFRTTGNWKTQVKTTGGNMGYFKFIRSYGVDSVANAHVHLRVRDNTDTSVAFFDPVDSSWIFFDAGIDLVDGNWHSVSFVVVINHPTDATGNITQTAWFDDWDMVGDPVGTRTTTNAGFGGEFRHGKTAGNWSSTYPSTLMGIDIDDLEVWNGLPTTTAQLTVTGSTTTGMQIQ